MVDLDLNRTILPCLVETLLTKECEHLTKVDIKYWPVGHKKTMMNSMKGIITLSNHSQQSEEESLRASSVQPHPLHLELIECSEWVEVPNSLQILSQ